eukprot:GEMP01007178.1.p2 GENE.GEMP01007178.1~~GEMP01007178.1.p2  ORF type:complete len:326 (+),score=85.03 GEMP01007178.1:59-1036(+)
MALRAAQGKLHPLVLPTNQLWQQLWGRAPLSQDVLAELMKQAECPRAARLVALRSMACGEELSPAMYDRLIHLHVHHGDPQGALRLLGSAKLPIQGYEALLRSLVETNRTAKAWEVFQNLRTQELMEPTENMIVSMLHACLTEKNPDAADRLVDEFTRWTTEIELAHIAVLTTRQRTLGKALERYGQFLERNPPNVGCQRRLMQACERCGHTERAKILWRKIRSQNQDLKNVDAETVVSYIRVFKNADIPQKEKEKAVKYLWSLVLELEVSAPLLNALISVFGSAGLLKNVMETWEVLRHTREREPGGSRGNESMRVGGGGGRMW